MEKTFKKDNIKYLVQVYLGEYADDGQPCFHVNLYKRIKGKIGLHL